MALKDVKWGQVAIGAGVAVGLVLAGGLVNEAMDKTPYSAADLELAEVAAVDAVEPSTETVEVTVAPVVNGTEYTAEEVKALLDEVNPYLYEQGKEADAESMIQDEMESDDFREEVYDLLRDLGWDIDDVDDILELEVKDLEIDFGDEDDEEDNMEEMNFSADMELKVRFLENGEDSRSDRLAVNFDFEDSELESLEMDEE